MGSCAAPSAKGDDKFITTDYLQQCLYSSWQLSDVENYLRLQNEHHDTYYLPEHPVCWTVSREKG
ncbi:hypothetical protein DPV13_24595 [Escherichia coli]|nr:hypothetical protein [Escherichia coli]